MEYTLDLTLRPEGYREALIKYLASKQVKQAGIWLEYLSPKLTILASPAETYQRLKQLDEERVCARVTLNVLFEDTFTMWVESAGHMADLAKLEDMVPSARMIVDNHNRVHDILGFDLIARNDHYLYQD